MQIPYYYEMLGYPRIFMDEQENERDMERLKEYYPEVAKDILSHVEEECDKMEYEGSMMFDEYPDRILILRMCANIYEKVRDKYEVEDSDDTDEMLAMNKETRRRYPPKKNWLSDMIEVILFQEMHNRRCRHRNCRRRWWT